MFEWAAYNEKLVRRGELLLDLSFLSCIGKELRNMNEGKKGRPYRYGDSLFTFLSYIYAFIGNYRILEGLCRAFKKIIGNFPTPDHSTIHRRIKAEIKDVKIEGEMLIVDSSGFRLGRDKEWIEYRHRLRRRKKWLKMHIITDGKKIVKVLITTPNVGDSPAFRRMFRELKKELRDVKVLIADSAYDSRANFNLISQYGIKPLIKVRKNSSTLSKGAPSRRTAT